MSDNLPTPTLIPLSNPDKYPMSFSANFEEQVYIHMNLKLLKFVQNAKDDLFRKKINFQQQDYIENNQLICFGITQHEKS